MLDMKLEPMYQLDLNSSMTFDAIGSTDSNISIGLAETKSSNPLVLPYPQDLPDEVYQTDFNELSTQSMHQSMSSQFSTDSQSISQEEFLSGQHLTVCQERISLTPLSLPMRTFSSCSTPNLPDTAYQTLPSLDQQSQKTSNGKIISSNRKLDEIFDMVCNGGGTPRRPRSPIQYISPLEIKIEPITTTSVTTAYIPNDTKHFCTQCNKLFSAERYFKQHYNSVHIYNGPKQFKCMLCQRSFHTEKALQKHIDHEVYKPHNCVECNRTFNRKPDLIRHLFVHRKAKPYICMACQKTFIRSDQLTSHYRNCLITKNI